MKPVLLVKTIDNYPFDLPKYAKEGDSGFDLAASEEVTLNPQETKLIPTGLFFEIPEGYEIQVRPRSGVSLKTPLRITNSPGTVDSGYRGEIKVIMQNTSITTPYIIEKGDRIAQAVLATVSQAVIIHVDELGTTERGDTGFGSSGSKA